MGKLQLYANAKINLTLDIVGTREDGYHLLKSLMHSVSLCDEIIIESVKKTGIALAFPGMYFLENKQNTVYKAASLFFDALNFLPQIKITVKKRIPSQAGLGGGSADAAAVLVGLNRLYGEPFSLEELKAMALKVGADVPFCIEGGCAFSEGIGEVLTPKMPLKNCYFVVSRGEVGNSTPKIFKKYDLSAKDVFVDTEKALEAIDKGNLKKLVKAMGNALEEAAQVPLLSSLKKEGRRHGALATQMTGSGSAVFSMFKAKKKAERYKHFLEKSYPEHKVFLCESVDRGVIFK